MSSSTHPPTLQHPYTDRVNKAGVPLPALGPVPDHWADDIDIDEPPQKDAPDPSTFDSISVPRPWSVTLKLTGLYVTELEALAWINCHNLFYARYQTTKSTVEFRVADDDIPAWKRAIAESTAPAPPELTFLQTQPKKRIPTPPSSSGTKEYVLRGLAVGDQKVKQADVQRLLDASLSHLQSSPGSFPIRKIIQTGASHMAFFNAPSDLVLPQFLYIGEDGCTIEEAGHPTSVSNLAQRTVQVGNLRGHLRCARNLDPLKRSVNAEAISVPGIYSKMSSKMQRGPTAHLVFTTRALAVEFVRKKSGTLLLSGDPHPVRLLVSDMGTRTNYCWKCWEPGHFATDCDNQPFGGSPERSRAEAARRRREQREFDQLAMNTLPADRVPAVQQRALSAIVNRDRRHLPDNPATYALIASRLVPTPPVPHPRPSTLVTPPPRTPPPPAISGDTQRGSSSHQTGGLQLEPQSGDSVHAKLDALLRIVKDLQTRVIQLEESTAAQDL